MDEVEVLRCVRLKLSDASYRRRWSRCKGGCICLLKVVM